MKSVEQYKEMYPTEGKILAVGDEECWSSSSTSSIGRNSDDEKSSDGGENEVESLYKGGPLDMMESLEEVLPIRGGISKFYNGKSKSFTSLIETTTSSSSSIKDITKPENAYSRRRRNIASHNLWDKTRSGFSVRNNNGCGISKRSISSSRSTLALAMAMNNSDNGSSNSSSSSSIEDSLSPRSPMMMMIPPLHPQSKGHYGNYAWKSYSVADLSHCSRLVAGGGAIDGSRGC